MANTTKESAKTRRPILRGKNSPKNLHKAFRSSGNSVIVKAAINSGRGYVCNDYWKGGDSDDV